MAIPNIFIGWLMEENERIQFPPYLSKGQLVNDFGKIKDEAIDFLLKLYKKDGVKGQESQICFIPRLKKR